MNFRAKPVGWRNDNYRHSLAARGLTKRSFVLNGFKQKKIDAINKLIMYNPELESKNEQDIRNMAANHEFDDYPEKWGLTSEEGDRIRSALQHLESDSEIRKVLEEKHPELFKRRDSMAFKGFSEEERAKLITILANNPQLASKVKSLAEDIQLSESPAQAHVSNLTPSEYADLVNLNKFIKANSSAELRSLRPNVIHVDPSFFSEPETYQEQILSHESSHLAHAARLPGGIEEFRKFSVPVDRTKIPQLSSTSGNLSREMIRHELIPAEILAEPVDQYPPQMEFRKFALENIPELKNRTDVLKVKVKQGRPGLPSIRKRPLQRWKVGPGEQGLFEPKPSQEDVMQQYRRFVGDSEPFGSDM